MEQGEEGDGFGREEWGTPLIVSEKRYSGAMDADRHSKRLFTIQPPDKLLVFVISAHGTLNST